MLSCKRKSEHPLSRWIYANNLFRGTENDQPVCDGIQRSIHLCRPALHLGEQSLTLHLGGFSFLDVNPGEHGANDATRIIVNRGSADHDCQTGFVRASQHPFLIRHPLAVLERPCQRQLGINRRCHAIRMIEPPEFRLRADLLSVDFIE